MGEACQAKTDTLRTMTISIESPDRGKRVKYCLIIQTSLSVALAKTVATKTSISQSGTEKQSSSSLLIATMKRAENEYT